MLENHALFGIPLPFIGFVCLIILPIIFWNVWPQKKAQKYDRISWPSYILHFFQPLAWVLIGTAAFVEIRSPVLSAILASLGVIVYIIFVITAIRA
jgi:hypothetical protein